MVEGQGPSQGGVFGGHPLLLRAGVATVVVGVALMNCGAWIAVRHQPGIGGPWCRGLGIGLGQLGFAAVVSWYLSRFDGFEKTLVALRLALPTLAVSLVFVLFLRVRGGSLAEAPFLFQAVSGTILAVSRMVFTAIGVVLILQSALGTLTPW